MPPPAPNAKKQGVKKGIDIDDQRRRRETSSVQLRKDKREEGLLKRRTVAQPETSASSSTDATSALLSASGSSSSSALDGAAGNPAVAAPKEAEVKLEDLSRYVAAARSDQQADILFGVTCVRRLLSKESSPPVKAVLTTGVLPRLVELLLCPDSKIQFEAAWALTNIASTEFTQAVVDAGAVPPLVRGMMSADANLREQSLWCIGNVSGEGSQLRDLLINTPGCVEALLQNLAYPGNIALLRNATWTMSNLCRGKPSPSPAAVQAMLPALAFLLNNADLGVLTDALWGVSYLTDGDDTTINLVVDHPGIVKRCVELMSNPTVTVVTPALRVIGNLISGSDKCTQVAIDNGALRAIVPLFGNQKRTIRREACWAVSNIAAGTREQISTMMAVPGLMSCVTQQLRSNVEWQVRKEACWVVFNVATTGDAEHVLQMVACNVIEPLSSLLDCTDPRILTVALDAVCAVLDMGKKLTSAQYSSMIEMFEEAGVVEALDNLQQFNDTDVYNKCILIVEKHFSSEEGEDEDALINQEAPSFAAFGGGSFGSSSSATGGAIMSSFPAQGQSNGGFNFGSSAFGSNANFNPSSSQAIAGFKTPPATAAPPSMFSAANPPMPVQPVFNFTGGFTFN